RPVASYGRGRAGFRPPCRFHRRGAASVQSRTVTARPVYGSFPGRGRAAANSLRLMAAANLRRRPNRRILPPMKYARGDGPLAVVRPVSLHRAVFDDRTDPWPAAVSGAAPAVEGGSAIG